LGSNGAEKSHKEIFKRFPHNIIVLWNTLYINAALQQLEQEGEYAPRTSPGFHRWFMTTLSG
jgi:hypothetical protein